MQLRMRYHNFLFDIPKCMMQHKSPIQQNNCIIANNTQKTTKYFSQLVLWWVWGKRVKKNAIKHIVLWICKAYNKSQLLLYSEVIMKIFPIFSHQDYVSNFNWFSPIILFCLYPTKIERHSDTMLKLRWDCFNWTTFNVRL